MIQRLYFVQENEDLVGVFSDKEDAREEIIYLKEDHPLDHFRLYGFTMAELENYPDEYDYASDAGLLN